MVALISERYATEPEGRARASDVILCTMGSFEDSDSTFMRESQVI
jgi:hypothetical protein